MLFRSVAFENEKKYNPIPLLVLCNLFKDSDIEDDVVISTKAALVASELGNEKATKIANELSVTKLAKEKMKNRSKMLQSFKQDKLSLSKSKRKAKRIPKHNKSNPLQKSMNMTLKKFSIDSSQNNDD